MSQINETTIKTPGVYTTEIPSFPPSVAQVSTAIPAFLGHTDFASRNGNSLFNKAIPLSSLLDFESWYGKGPQVNITRVDLDQNNNVTNADLSQDYLLYDSIRMFFLNGGGKCYIISIGTYSDAIDKSLFEKAITTVLSKEDEPTLILFPDAVKLTGTDLYYVQNLALKQCASLQDRFTICDLMPSSDSPSWNATVDEFRNNIDLSTMNYAAAYTPYLNTNLSKNITYRNLSAALFKFGSPITLASLVQLTDTKTLALISYLEKSIADSNFISATIPANLMDGYAAKLLTFKTEAVKPLPNNAKSAFEDLFKYIYDTVDTFIDDIVHNNPVKLNESIPPVLPSTTTINFVLASIKSIITNSLRSRLSVLNSYNKTLKVFTDTADEGIYAIGHTWDAAEWTVAAIDAMADANVVSVPDDGKVYPIIGIVPGDPDKETKYLANMVGAEPKISAVMKDVNDAISLIRTSAALVETGFEKTLSDTFSLYRAINTKVAAASTALPPSGAMAGIYAQVDGTRGVWKAPANVSVNGIQSFAYTIDNIDNDGLNVSDTGKSINALRFFPGKGNLVWGARTVDGNSNEWRYISVRRFFIMVEESAKKATMPFVFEPNDANTWTKVKAMLENFLTILWRQGALAGAKPEQAFFVKCGLGQTMTAIDVLEGRLLVEIGMAAVRPAEFIILRFSHLVQQS